MHRGWVKEHRKTLDSAIWKMNPLAYKIFRFFIMAANHKPNKFYVSNMGGEVTVECGELITSRDSLARALRYKEGLKWIEPTPQQIRTILNKLESCKMITKLPTRGCLHIRIVNYGLYQSGSKEATEVATGVATGQQPGSNREQEERIKKEGTKESYQPKYPTVITILHGIEGWPVDPKKDDNLIQRNKDKHSLTIDQLEQAAIELATWYDDNPGKIEKSKANPRMRFNTFARNRARWDRESSVASDDGQPVHAITVGHIRQDLTSYLIRAANGEMDLEQFGAVISERYRGQTVSPEVILEAWELAHKEFGENDGR